MTPVGFQDNVAFAWKCEKLFRRALKHQRGSASPERPHHRAPGHP